MTPQFWDSYRNTFLRTFKIPVYLPPASKKKTGVWPSFFANELQFNRTHIRRKYVQIAHPDGSKVSLYVKGRDLMDFRRVITPLLEDGMIVGETTSWPTVSIKVPVLDMSIPVADQLDTLTKVGEAASRLFHFYIAHEETILGIKRVG